MVLSTFWTIQAWVVNCCWISWITLNELSLIGQTNLKYFQIQVKAWPYINQQIWTPYLNWNSIHYASSGFGLWANILWVQIAKLIKLHSLETAWQCTHKVTYLWVKSIQRVSFLSQNLNCEVSIDSHSTTACCGQRECL